MTKEKTKLAKPVVSIPFTSIVKASRSKSEIQETIVETIPICLLI